MRDEGAGDVGVAVESPEDRGCQDLEPLEFNALGAANAFKWGRLAHYVERHDFSREDAIAGYAEAHRLRLRGHALVWARAGKPADLEQTIREAVDPEARLKEVVAAHIHTTLDHFRGWCSVPILRHTDGGG